MLQRLADWPASHVARQSQSRRQLLNAQRDHLDANLCVASRADIAVCSAAEQLHLYSHSINGTLLLLRRRSKCNVELQFVAA